MKRPMLVSGTAIGLSSAILVLTGITALPFLLLITVSVFILYLIKPLKLRQKIIIPTICISVILSCVCFTAYHLTKIAPSMKLDKVVTSISGKIITTPQTNSYGTNFTLKTDTIGNNEHTTKISVFVPLGSEKDFKLYDYISLSNTKLEIVRDDYNNPDSTSMGDGVILETTAENINILWESERTPYYYCLRFKELVTEQIKSYLDSYDSGFLLGMLFGDKENLDSDITNDFSKTGIAHLLAVSGLHTGTWCSYIIIFLKLLRLKEKTHNAICLLFLCGFCVVSAFTPSVLRASIMMAVVLLAPFFKEEQDSLNSLGFAVTLLVLKNPYIITSVSFLLSVSATLGVLISPYISTKVTKLIRSIKNTKIQKLVCYFSNNLIISSFADLFTLPVMAYFFGTFSIVAPLTNILCVKLSFWGMLLGIVSTAVSFIPQNAVQLTSVFLFRITSLLLRLVMKTADYIANFKFCSIPVHKEYFIIGIFISVLLLLIAFLIFKKKQNAKIIKAFSVVCAVSMALCIVLPCTKLTPSTLTVLNVGNGVNVSIRSGLHYGFLNCGTNTDDTPYNYLPRATCENLEYTYISKYNTKTNSITALLSNHFPDTTIVTEYVKESFRENGKELPDNTIIADTYKYTLNNEITLETVDTYGMNCAIIESSEKSVAVCYGTHTDLNTVFDSYGTPDILILSQNIPEELPENVETLIISSGSDVIINKNITTLKTQCNEFYTTAEDGNIKILM